MTHIVLLGDSVFDNAAYVAGGPDVVAQLRADLGTAGKATLAAIDGAVIASVASQLARVPPDATHLVVSVGGNDALRHAGVLEEPARSMGGAIERLGGVREAFERDYRRMLAALTEAGRPAALCTIYDPRFPDARMQHASITALTLFNDVILREAASHGLPVLDLRLICDSDADFANPIEPSARGGEKITTAIARLLAEHDFARRRTEIFAG